LYVAYNLNQMSVNIAYSRLHRLQVNRGR